MAFRLGFLFEAETKVNLIKKEESGLFRYVIIQENVFSHDIGSFMSFGIQAVEEVAAARKVVARVSDISTDADFVQALADLCTNLQLDPIHLFDVVADKFAEC